MKVTILSQLKEALKDELPELYVDRGVKPRLLLKQSGNDYFNFYFSNKIPNTFRCAYVLDLDIKHSERRSIFRDTLKDYSETIEGIYGYPVLNMSDERIVRERNYSHWIRLMKHRWYSIYLMCRSHEVDWQDISQVVDFLRPEIIGFVEKTDFLLQKFPPPLK